MRAETDKHLLFRNKTATMLELQAITATPRPCPQIKYNDANFFMPMVTGPEREILDGAATLSSSSASRKGL